jgi:hypothetical protein
MGFVSRDSNRSNLKVANTGTINTIVRCGEEVSTKEWAELRHNRLNALQVTLGDVGVYSELNTISQSPILNIVSGDPIVQVEGTNSGLIRFLKSGTYQISLYIDCGQTPSETVNQNVIQLCLSQSTPTSSTSPQLNVLLPSYLFNQIWTSGSITTQYDVNENDVLQLYIASIVFGGSEIQINDIIIVVNEI